jgi:threonine dehydrogenase-like Zn-dependent dehydrogenase
MRAAVYHGQHDVRVESVPEPGDPGPGEVVLEVVRAAICGTDASEWAHGPHVTRNLPLTIGHEFTGRVVALGDGVEQLALGDRVVSGAGVSCGQCAWCRAGRTNLCASYQTLGQQLPGGLAELVATPADICRPVPAACGDEAASLAQPLAVALHAIRRAAIRPGETVAIVGVGGIGAFLVAAARAQGATRIVALDIDSRRLEQASALGAHETIDVAGLDLAATILEATAGAGAEVVVEASGVPAACAGALAATARGGRMVLVGLPSEPPRLDLVAAVVREVDVLTSAAHVCDVDLPAALDVLATQDLLPTVLDSVIPLEQLVDDGLRALAEGRAHGKVVVDPRLR